MRDFIKVENTQSEKGLFNDTIIVQTDNVLKSEIPIRNSKYPCSSSVAAMPASARP